MKLISISIIILIVLPLPVRTESKFLDTKAVELWKSSISKFVGKLTMVVILSAAAFVVKMLVDRDRKEADKIHEKLGPPDRIVEFQEGFDHWRIEWYRDKIYIFRNGALFKSY